MTEMQDTSTKSKQRSMPNSDPPNFHVQDGEQMQQRQTSRLLAVLFGWLLLLAACSIATVVFAAWQTPSELHNRPTHDPATVEVP